MNAPPPGVYAELDVVRLVRDVPEQGLRKGMVGTIVLVFERPGRAYEVEFADERGRTVAQVALTEELLEPLDDSGDPGAWLPGQRATIDLSVSGVNIREIKLLP